MTRIDYMNVEIPENKDTKDYTYAERRAKIIQEIINKGYPSIPQSKTAERFGVNQSQISHDMKAIRKYMINQNPDQLKLISETVYQNAVRKLQEQGEYFKASKVMSMWNEWLFNTGKLDKSPEKLEHKFDILERARKIAEEEHEEDKG